VAALKIVEVMLATGQPLSELKRVLTKFPQLTSALKVKEKRPLDELPRVKETIQSLEAELGSRGRVLVRYSGTETKLRLLIEGASDAIVQEGMARLDAAVRGELTVL
jgi:phosphoglucosamine mutase